MEGSGYSMLVGGDKQSEGQGTDGGRYLWELCSRGCRIFALNSLKMLPHTLPKATNGLQSKL